MAKPGQSSFRRILLSRILLLSVPVLLIGEAVAFRKTRYGMLETARQNLTESAVRKGESIGNAIAALKANLFVASQTTVLKQGTANEAQQFLDQLAPQLTTPVQCIQLTNFQTGKMVASTCGNRAISSARAFDGWIGQKNSLSQMRAQIHVKAVYVPLSTDLPLSVLQKQETSLISIPNRDLHKTATPNVNTIAHSTTQSVFDSNENRYNHPQRQLQLLLSAPVYNNAGQLSYALSIQSALDQQERDQPGSLAGSTVVIAQDGTILEYPIADRAGRNIEQNADAEQIKSIVRNAIAGRKDFLHLSLESRVELLAGYTAIPSPITNEPEQHWIILAVTGLDNALFGLQEIKIILLVLTVGLLGASLLATLYLARDLARPVEELRDYALNLQSHHAAERVPHNFRIREFDQLAEALNKMMERLKAWALEIETAWKEAQAANQLKSEFLATTSHELRTPLNAIIGCVRLVRDGYCDDREEEMEFLQRADEAAIHLLGIINDLLDVAKIEAGKLSVVMEPIDLRQLLKEVINLQIVHIQQKGLQLITSECLEPIPVQVDPAKLKQVLINVIGNAVKFTEQGSITIKTRIEPAADHLDKSGTKVVVIVKDTGMGIAPAQQDKLFHPFVMVDGTTTRKFGGTGLGLAISRNLIELMKGSIMLLSAGSGQGTTVAITLPLMEVSLLRTSEGTGYVTGLTEKGC